MSKTIVIGSSAPFDKGSGINTYSKELTKEVIKKGFKVLYICPTANNLDWINSIDNLEAEFFDSSGCPIIQTNIIKNAILKREDIVGIINNDNIFLQSLAHLFSVPFISVVHLLNFTIYPATLVNKKYVDYFVTISNDMCMDFIKKSGIEPHRVPLVYNGISHSSLDENFSKDNNKLSLIAGGEYSRRKGGDLLKNLLLTLSQSNIDFDFKWFGGVPSSVTEIFKDDKRFQFYEKLPREEYMSYMKSGDIYLFPSREEGCPMSLLEAMSYGLIPIASDGIGAMNAIIQHGKNGYILSLNNWNKETFKLISFLSCNKKLMSKLSSTAEISVRESFAARNTVNDVVSLLDFPIINRTNKKQSDEIFYVYYWHRLAILKSLNFIEKNKRRILYRLGIIKKHSLLK